MKLPKKKAAFRIIAAVLAVPLLPALIFFLIGCASFGRSPRGERLERIKKSPNYHDGAFRNKTPAVNRIEQSRRSIGGLFKFFFRSNDGRRPKQALPSVKPDLSGFGPDENVFVWFGHSSFFLQVDGKRFLVDPVLIQGSPVFFANRMFKGTKVFRPKDIPEIDCLIITHDHWDHLDYWTVKKLNKKTSTVVCGLGVGEYFEQWGYESKKLVELDWEETFDLGDGFTLYCFPARHSSGRRLNRRGETLWTSWALQTPSRTIYISGDTGYDTHFAEIGARFEKIDLAIMENGQYNENWMYNHLLPDRLIDAVNDLHPDMLVTVHNAKFTLSTHSWKEPLENISAASEREGFNLKTPMIGETLYLDRPGQTFRKWWEDLE